MKIVPSGTRRIMVAQSADIDALTSFDPAVNAPVPEGAMQQDIEPTQDALATPNPTADLEQGTPDIREYIFKKLEGFGYPPRRLEEFEKGFVKETLFSGGYKEVSITLPDRYYGQRKSLSDNDVNSIIKEIGEQFGYSFIDAQREDKKIVINLTTQQKESEEDETVTEDVLDEVYGTPANKKKTKKKAETVEGMLKQRRKDTLDMMIKHIEE